MSDAFIAELLEPVAGGVPVDTHYNALMRQIRRAPWRRASYVAEFHDTRLRHLHVACLVARDDGDEAAMSRLSVERDAEVKLWRQALVRQILTPAPALVEVEWKVKTAARDPYLPIDKAEIVKAIEADKAFLAAHPASRRKLKERPW